MWIAILDRLPENNTTTLLYSPGCEQPFTVADFVLCEFDDAQAYWWYDHDAEGNYAPTHWMELPEPPNAELRRDASGQSLSNAGLGILTTESKP